MSQRKRTPANVEAEKRYAPKRTKKPISFRLDDDDMAALDAKRGDKSRGAIAEELVLKWLKRP